MTLPASLALATLLTTAPSPSGQPGAVLRQPQSLLAAGAAHVRLMQVPARNRPTPPPGRISRRGQWVVLGVVAGAIAGGVAGDAVTRDCACDSPGYGALYGIPIGAVAGGLLAWKHGR